jgi:hypothetical protein
MGTPAVPISFCAAAAINAAFFPRITTRFPSKRISDTKWRKYRFVAPLELSIRRSARLNQTLRPVWLAAWS